MPNLYKGVIKGMGEIRYKRKKSNCKGTEIYRDLLRNPHQQFCLDQQDLETNAGLPVLVFDCHGEKGNQYW